jgi:hypothetical protein
MGGIFGGREGRRRDQGLEEIAKATRGIERAVWRIVKWLEQSGRTTGFHYTVGPVQSKERKKMSITVQSTNEEKVKITAAPVTSTGQPAPLDGPVRVSVISGDSTVDQIDATSFFIVSSDTPGDTSYLVEADADLGAGVVLIQDTITYTVAGALAVALGLVAGAPEPK